MLSSVQAESAAARTACGGKILGAPHFRSPFFCIVLLMIGYDRIESGGLQKFHHLPGMR